MRLDSGDITLNGPSTFEDPQFCPISKPPKKLFQT